MTDQSTAPALADNLYNGVDGKELTGGKSPGPKVSLPRVPKLAYVQSGGRWPSSTRVKLLDN